MQMHKASKEEGGQARRREGRQGGERAGKEEREGRQGGGRADKEEEGGQARRRGRGVRKRE